LGKLRCPAARKRGHREGHAKQACNSLKIHLIARAMQCSSRADDSTESQVRSLSMSRNRRDFLKGLGWIGGALLCRPNSVAGRDASFGTVHDSIDFQYRTIAIEHLAEA